MDALDLLIGDHNRFRGLFTRFQAAHEAEDTSAMKEVADAIFADLEVHTSLEEQVFYPAVHDLNDELAEVVDEGVEEHHVADVLMAEARELEPGADRWVAKLTVLIESNPAYVAVLTLIQMALLLVAFAFFILSRASLNLRPT